MFSASHRGQIIVEFALIFSLFLFMVLESLQLGVVLLGEMRLQHAVIESAVAGASEPDVPQRCNVAEQTLTQVYGRPPTSFQCTGIGSLVEISATSAIAIFSPFHEDSDGWWEISATESAVVRNEEAP